MSKSAVLTIRKHADKTTQTRHTRFYEVTDENGKVIGVEKRLVNPDTAGDEHEAWPLVGVSFANPDDGSRADPPKLTTINTQKITEGISEGWVTAEGANPVVRPAGPTMDTWHSTQTGQPHIFMHYDRLTFHTLDGDFTYKVTHQPDKYADHAEATYEIKAFKSDDKTKVTPEIYEAGATRVDHFYVIELEG
jgi:hypothetical protein